MPYTTMCVSAISIGFTLADIRDMPYPRLAWMLHQYNATHATGSGENKHRTRKGTTRDLMGM